MSRGTGPYRPQRSLPTSTIPCFYDSVSAQSHTALPRRLSRLAALTHVHMQHLSLLCPCSTKALYSGKYCPPSTCTLQTVRDCGAGLRLGQRRWRRRGGPPATGLWLQRLGAGCCHLTYSLGYPCQRAAQPSSSLDPATVGSPFLILVSKSQRWHCSPALPHGSSPSQLATAEREGVQKVGVCCGSQLVSEGVTV